jgi:hypothetical protein
MAVVLTSVALLAVACSSSDEPSKTVASVPSAKGSQTDTAKGGGKADPVAYAKCMRENGLPDFPDPKSGGRMQLPAGIDPNSPEFRKADSSCKKYLPTNGGQQGVSPDQGWPAAEKLKYAKCMRENGVPKFPDPASNGGFLFKQGDAIDPESPQFKSAEKACSKYQPQNAQKTVPGGQG